MAEFSVSSYSGDFELRRGKSHVQRNINQLGLSIFSGGVKDKRYRGKQKVFIA
jgi:hypothetical protein